MIFPIIENDRTLASRCGAAPFARRAAARLLVPVALVLALLTSGCDKCGDYFWEHGSKSCHDESQLK
jgi:hypothetical protein